MINPIGVMTQPVSNKTRHAYTDTSAPQQQIAERGAGATKASTVNISAQGKLAAKIDMDSLESLRIPKWMVDFIPKQSVLNSSEAIKETRALLSKMETQTVDAQPSAAAKQSMRNQSASPLSATQTMRANTEFLAKFQNELREYSGLLRQAYDQAKQEHGINSHEDYVTKVLDAPEDNLPLRDSLKAKLLDNPRALELMNTLGIVRPYLA